MFSWRAAGPTHLFNGPSGDVAADVNVSITPNQPPNERDGLRGRVRAAPRRAASEWHSRKAYGIGAITACLYYLVFHKNQFVCDHGMIGMLLDLLDLLSRLQQSAVSSRSDGSEPRLISGDGMACM